MSTDIVLDYPWENEHYYFLRHYRIRLFEIVLQEVPPGILLDCGTGAGIFLEDMAAKGWQCYGFDGRLVVSEDSMSCGVKLVQFEFDPEIPSLPFLGVSFDLISAGGFVDYLPSLGGFLDQAAERLKPEGSLLFTAINGHHEESRKNPGHPAWQLHLPEVVSAQLSHRFSQVNLYLVKVIDSRGDEREDEILSKAIESKVVVATPAQVHRLVSATDDIQQCVYMATSPQTSATF